MPEIKVKLSMAQMIKAEKAVQKRAGSDNEKSSGQLLKDYLMNQLAGIVEYDAKQEAQSKIERF